MLSKYFACSIACFLSIFSVMCQSNDTLRVMSYNLLYYGENTSFCDNGNNPIASKDAYFKIITNYIDPDILVVNEMGASAAYSNRILNKVLNVDGVNKYKACSIKNNTFSSIVNGVFYNKQKLEIVWQRSIKKDLNNSDLVRVIDLIKFYYLDPELAIGRDTTFLYVGAAHLKAGDSQNDASAREIAAESFMEYISSELDPGYMFFCGDLNLYNANEGAYQEFTGSTYGEYQFYDLASESGNWHNTNSFSDIHTQSTRSSNTNSGCFSGGGMDDRFDFILGSGQVYQDTGAISYISQSYKTVGQDGSHFNQSLIQGGNNSVPSNVLAALFEMSDHLPVVADFKIQRLEPLIDTTDTVTGYSSNAKPQSRVWMQNDELRMNLLRNTQVEIIDMNGISILSQPFGLGYHSISTNQIASGLYFIRTQNTRSVSVDRVLILR